MRANARWVVRTGKDQYFLLGRNQGELLGSIDGDRTVEGLTLAHRERFDAHMVSTLVDRFEAHGLVSPRNGDGEQVVGKFGTTLMVPCVLLRLVAPFANAVLTYTRIALLLTLGPLVLLPLIPMVVRSLKFELTIPDLLLTAVILCMTVVLHELAHAGVVWVGTGSQPRLGIRLQGIRVTPFCDVAPLWALSGRWERVAAPLAGPLVNVISLLSITAWAFMSRQGEGLPPGAGLAWVAVFTAWLSSAIPAGRNDAHLVVAAYVERRGLNEEARAESLAFLRSVRYLFRRSESRRPALLAYDLLRICVALCWCGLVAGLAVYFVLLIGTKQFLYFVVILALFAYVMGRGDSPSLIGELFSNRSAGALARVGAAVVILSAIGLVAHVIPAPIYADTTIVQISEDGRLGDLALEPPATTSQETRIRVAKPGLRIISTHVDGVVLPGSTDRVLHVRFDTDARSVFAAREDVRFASLDRSLLSTLFNLVTEPSR